MCFLVISIVSSPKSEFSPTEGLVQISLVSPTMSLIESAGSHTALLRPVPMSFHLELSTALWLPWHRPRSRAGGPAGGGVGGGPAWVCLALPRGQTREPTSVLCSGCQAPTLMLASTPCKVSGWRVHWGASWEMLSARLHAIRSSFDPWSHRPLAGLGQSGHCGDQSRGDLRLPASAC